MSEPHVVVAGGGLAGLSAAIACIDGGARVTLLEAKRRLGGATYSFERDGLLVDNGQHVFLRCCTAYQWFIDRLGVADKVTLQSRLEIPVVHRTGKTAWIKSSRLPAPFHLAPSLATFRFLRPLDRVRVAMAAGKLVRLDVSNADSDRKTFGDWLLENGQSPEAIASFWDLFTLPTLNAHSSQASLALAAKVFQTGLLRNRTAGDIGYGLVPLSELHVAPAVKILRAAGAEVRTDSRVVSLAGDGGSIRVFAADEPPIRADTMILAVPHDGAAKLLPSDALPDPAALERLGTSPIVNIHVLYDRKVMEWPFAAGSGGPVQWVFDRTSISGCERGQYLAVSLSGADEFTTVGNSDLRDTFVKALSDMFPAARSASVESFFVTRELNATFFQSPGTAELRPGPVTGVPGLYLAGAWTDTGWPATMEGAVRSGLAAAREALVHLSLTRSPPTFATP